MSRTKLSVIVPVYNAAAYLDQCIQSLIAQDIDGMEIILVDDGSADTSGQICDNYALLHDNIHVIHTENAGVSAARNTGIDMAQGEYIGFVDSDDWVESAMFRRLIDEASQTNADIVMCDAMTVFSNGRKESDTIPLLSQSTTITHEQITPDLLLQLAGSVWRCIYRKSNLISQFSIRFSCELKFSEDRVFNLHAMGNANKIRYVKEPYYNRFVNTQSAVHRFHPDYFDACKLAANAVSEAIRIAWHDDNVLQTAYLEQFINGAFMAICNYYYNTSTLTSCERKTAVKKMCEDSQLRSAIIQYGANQRNKWIIRKNYTMLIIYAKLANFKYGR